MSEPVRFLLNGERVDVAGLSPQTTLLEFLRDERRLTGTKEGCAEGDCGACTVVVAERAGAARRLETRQRVHPAAAVGRRQGGVHRRKPRSPHDGALHPVQQALVDCHASQCGFCTPGFAMSLFGLYKTARAPSRRDDRRRAVRQPLPLHRLPSDRRGRAADVRAAAGRRLARPGLRTTAPRACRRAERSARRATRDCSSATRSLEYAHGGQRWSAPRTAAELAAAVRDASRRTHRRRHDRPRAVGHEAASRCSTT